MSLFVALISALISSMCGLTAATTGIANSLVAKQSTRSCLVSRGVPNAPVPEEVGLSAIVVCKQSSRHYPISAAVISQLQSSVITIWVRRFVPGTFSVFLAHSCGLTPLLYSFRQQKKRELRACQVSLHGRLATKPMTIANSKIDNISNSGPSNTIFLQFALTYFG